MATDSLTLKDYLVALERGQVEEFERDVLDLLEPMVLSNYDGWGDAALCRWYQSMLDHVVAELGGPEVVLGMLGVEVNIVEPTSGESESN
jgi:hypothetical protein